MVQMKEFPVALEISNKHNFEKIHYNRLKCYLRRFLYEHVISRQENEYFSLDEFNQKVGNLDTTKKLVIDLIPELEKLGWKCKTSYGGTGLFIYSTDKPPANCWEEAEQLT